MIEDTASAPAEGEALPVPPPSRTASWEGAFPVVPQAPDGTSCLDRVIAAIERWYERHFHAAAVSGTAPITADDKAALIQHVADAVAPPATQE
jgi:hypothetical protein